MATPYKDIVLATSGLISLWPLDEAAGTNAADAQSGYTGEYKESPTLGQTSILPSGEGLAVKLNGTTQYIRVPDQAALRIADVFSFEGWIFPEAFGGDIFSPSVNGKPELRAEEKFWLGQKEIAIMCTSTTAMSTANGHHLVVTKNGASVKLYLNRVDVSGVLTDKTFASSATDWLFGRNGNFALNFFKGRLQYLAMYNAALSAATVEAHYAAGLSKPTLPPKAASRGLVLR